MKRILIGLIALTALGGCGIFGGDKKPKTPVLGDRVAVLTAETGAEIEPALADLPVIVPAPEANAEWAQPGGNPQKSMGHPSLGLALGQAWSARIKGSSPKARLASGPVVAGGRVYVIDTEATVYAFDAKSGAKLWKVPLVSGDGKDRDKDKDNERAKRRSDGKGVAFGGGVSVDGGRVYATTGTGDAVALDAADGKLVWRKHPAGPLRGAPVIALGNVYITTQDNQIYALKADSGDTVWTEAGTLETAGVFGVAAPSVAQGTVVAGFSSGELTAYRYENGRAVWQDALSRTSISTSVSSLSDIDAAPVIDQGRVYAIGQGGRMVAMELVTGQRLWELNIAGLATPWVAGDWLFAMTDDAKLIAIQRTSGKVRWIAQLPRWRNEKNKSGQINWVGPVLAGGRLIVASSAGQLVNVAVADGSLGAGIRTGASISLAPAVANNTLYILDDDGRLTAWR
jgi:outer membrane protein assembly factor BamB